MAIKKNDQEEPPEQANDWTFGNPKLVEPRNAVRTLKSGKSKTLLRLSELNRRKKELDITSEEAISELIEIEAETSAARTVLKAIEEKLDDAQKTLHIQVKIAHEGRVIEGD